MLELIRNVRSGVETKGEDEEESAETDAVEPTSSAPEVCCGTIQEPRLVQNDEYKSVYVSKCDVLSAVYI